MEGCLYIICWGGGGDDEKDGEEEGYNTHNARGVIRSGHHE